MEAATCADRIVTAAARKNRKTKGDHKIQDTIELILTDVQNGNFSWIQHACMCRLDNAILFPPEA